MRDDAHCWLQMCRLSQHDIRNCGSSFGIQAIDIIDKQTNKQTIKHVYLLGED